jgi:hypothetical protein
VFRIDHYLGERVDHEALRAYNPCDDFVSDPVLGAWRGVTVRASSEQVWPWVAQIRLAPYSYDWIDNLGRSSPLDLRGLPEPVPGERFTAALRGDGTVANPLARPRPSRRRKRSPAALAGRRFFVRTAPPGADGCVEAQVTGVDVALANALGRLFNAGASGQPGLATQQNYARWSARRTAMSFFTSGFGSGRSTAKCRALLVIV